MSNNNEIGQSYDVVVVGGGAAGLSGAVALSRSRRSVLVVDAGEPRNTPAAHMHNFLSRDGMNPLALLEVGRAEVRGYGGHVVRGRVRSAAQDADGFRVTLDDGRSVSARRLLITTGLMNQLPRDPRLARALGPRRHPLPYCHGWEIRDQAVGVLATGPMAVHQALLFRQLTDDLVYFSHTAPPLGSEQVEQLVARDVRVVDGRVVGLEVNDGHLKGVRLEDGTLVAREGLVVCAPMVARSEILASLGIVAEDHPLGLGQSIRADPSGQTEIQWVWVAGNVTDLSATVIAAAAQGMVATAAINADLIAEDTRLAVSFRQLVRS
jgi:thioredoxin reductase